MSTAYNPNTGLFYVMALEDCQIYYKGPRRGRPRSRSNEPGRKYLRAIDVETGKIAWESRLEGPSDTWSGTLSTDGGLVFFGDPSGAFVAADAKTGERLWSFQTSQKWQGLADDLPDRKDTVCGDRIGTEHPLVRPARLNSSTP